MINFSSKFTLPICYGSLLYVDGCSLRVRAKMEMGKKLGENVLTAVPVHKIFQLYENIDQRIPSNGVSSMFVF